MKHMFICNNTNNNNDNKYEIWITNKETNKESRSVSSDFDEFLIDMLYSVHQNKGHMYFFIRAHTHVF